MLIKCILNSSRDTHYGMGFYCTDTKRFTVLKGSRIKLIASNTRLVYAATNARGDRSIVDADGVVLCDVEFQTPSAAAQFITGRSCNGHSAWRPDNKRSLKEFLKKEL